jgi:DNA polymerase-3 subunit gamma/tau
MSYTVLARKYRPQTFADLVGQEHVTRTLGNAIGTGRVAHAFLFTGVRGVGKTTTARILAKALNCVKGPTASPCGACDPCREITTGVDLDVLEIDGASNNSVEDVRRLQETIPFRPARDRFKIVIVDEVHMLSQGAFNAFLKTLEEPPPHVKFVFATTESHKVPITIRSRCQRYDFRLIPQAVVAARVREILAKESLEADEAAVAIVAREAAGSMRDALTLLDQIVAFAGTKLVGEEVARVLGIADRDLLHRAAASVLEGKGADALAVVDALASRGLDMLHFSRALTELVRDLVVLRVAGADTELVALAPEEKTRAAELASRTDELELQRAFASLSLLVDEIAKASMPRLVLEMGLVRLATRPPLRALAEVVARLEAIEDGRGGAAPSGPRSGGGGRGGGGAKPARGGGPPDEAAAILEKLRSDAIVAPTPVAPRDARPRPEPAPASASVSPPVSAAALASAPEPSARPGPGRDLSPRWEEVVRAVMESKPALGAVLAHARPTKVVANELVLAFPPGSFYARQADAPEARGFLAQVAEQVLGARPDVRVVEQARSADGAANGPTVAELEADRQRARYEATKKKALAHPMVVEALSVFDARADQADVRLEGD